MHAVNSARAVIIEPLTFTLTLTHTHSHSHSHTEAITNRSGRTHSGRSILVHIPFHRI